MQLKCEPHIGRDLGIDGRSSEVRRCSQILHRDHREDSLLPQENLANEAKDGIDDNRTDVHAEEWRSYAPNNSKERFGGPAT